MTQSQILHLDRQRTHTCAFSTLPPQNFVLDQLSPAAALAFETFYYNEAEVNMAQFPQTDFPFIQSGHFKVGQTRFISAKDAGNSPALILHYIDDVHNELADGIFPFSFAHLLCSLRK